MVTLYAYLAGIIDIDGYIFIARRVRFLAPKTPEFTDWHWWEAEHQKARNPLPVRQHRLAARPVK